MSFVNKIIKLLKTPKIFVFTIIWMMILVTVGTIAQKDMGLFAAQEKYFSSWFFWFFGNTIMLVYAILIQSYSVAFLSVFLMGMNIYGYVRWCRDE